MPLAGGRAIGSAVYKHFHRQKGVCDMYNVEVEDGDEDKDEDRKGKKGFRRSIGVK